MLRRLRGLFGLAIAWGIMWIPMGIVIGIIDGLARGASLTVGSLIQGIPLIAAIGAFSGFSFGLLFALVERKRTFGSLSLPRSIAWGVVGAAIYPVIALVVNPFEVGLANAATTVLPPFVILGAISAAGTLAIARRAPSELDGPDSIERLERAK